MTVLLAAGGICGALLAIAGVVALAARWVLLPWLREELSRPLAEVHTQVTNSHTTNLRDDITDLGRKMDEHLTWSTEETRRLWLAIGRRAG